MKLDVPAGATLSGDELAAQLSKWVKAGVMEADAAEAVRWTSAAFGKNGGGGNRLQHTHFVMIGAGSAMGPFRKLMELGAPRAARQSSRPGPPRARPAP